MLRNATLWTAALAFVATACTGGDDPAPLSAELSTFPPDATPPTIAPTPPQTAAPQTAAPATSTAPAGTPAPVPATDPMGRLVVLDGSGNVVTVDPDGSNRLVVAEAARDGAAFFQPIWAPGSARIAWGEASPEGFGLAMVEPDGERRTLAPMPAPPFYLYWSPDGRHVAALHNATNGIDLKVVAVEDGEPTYVGTGTPFYISWNPDAGDLVAHIGADRLTTIDTSGEVRDLGPTASGYQSPHWLREGIIHLDGETIEMMTVAGESTTLAQVPGPVSFVANPQGTLLAIQALGPGDPSLTVGLQDAPEVRPNKVVVIDLLTGETATIFEDLALAFFWSPDGEKLLILGSSIEPRHIDALVWDGAETTVIATYQPEGSFVRDVMPFFAQYAQSYQPWSPDSSAFAFAGTIDGTAGIWVQPAGGGEARNVGDGTWVSWSD